MDGRDCRSVFALASGMRVKLPNSVLLNRCHMLVKIIWYLSLPSSVTASVPAECGSFPRYSGFIPREPAKLNIYPTRHARD